jgi:hypothetical protein
MRQLVYSVDSSTILMKVPYPSKRQDGTDIFAIEWTYGTQEPDTSFYLIKDGFFMATEVKAVSDSTNPFREQRLAKVNPTDGESWKHTLGNLDSTFFTAKYLKERHTYCGTFSDVFAFVLTNSNAGTTDTILTTFYAKNIGYVGTDVNKDLYPDIQASYIKVGNQQFGALWPPKSPAHNAATSTQSIKRLIGGYLLLGMQTAANSGSNDAHNIR